MYVCVSVITVITILERKIFRWQIRSESVNERPGCAGSRLSSRDQYTCVSLSKCLWVIPVAPARARVDAPCRKTEGLPWERILAVVTFWTNCVLVILQSFSSFPFIRSFKFAQITLSTQSASIFIKNRQQRSSIILAVLIATRIFVFLYLRILFVFI